jgi:hypothetical protein
MNEPKSKRVVCDLPAPLAVQLERVAEQEMMPVAVYLRRLIAHALKAEARVAA